VTMRPDGSFTITNVQPGTYDIVIQSSHWLKKVLSDVVVAP
jgi:hypothetical protein